MFRFAAALLVLQFGLIDLAVPAAQRSRRRDPNPAEAFTVGVLRADGVLLPFATWDGEGWSSEWPRDIQSEELPIDLDSVPGQWWGIGGRPRELSLWFEGARVRDVKLERPAVVAVLCDRRIGVRTDARAEIPLPPPYEPFPKQGLVVSGAHEIGSIVRVSSAAPDFKALALAIADEAAEAEDRAVRRFTDWRHPFSKKDRRRVPIELEALYRSAMDDKEWGTASFIEAVKRYPVRPWEEGCGLMTSVSGWIRRSPKGEAKYDLSARITYCDRRGVTYMLPLGALTAGGQNFWIFQTSGWPGEWYSIVRPSPKAIEYHVDYQAGRGCSQ
jgi:hypothetical protein